MNNITKVRNTLKTYTDDNISDALYEILDCIVFTEKDRIIFAYDGNMCIEMSSRGLTLCEHDDDHNIINTLMCLSVSDKPATPRIIDRHKLDILRDLVYDFADDNLSRSLFILLDHIQDLGPSNSSAWYGPIGIDITEYAIGFYTEDTDNDTIKPLLTLEVKI